MTPDAALTAAKRLVDTIFLHDTVLVPVARPGFLGLPVSWDAAVGWMVAILAGVAAAWLAHVFNIRRLHRETRIAAYLRVASELQNYSHYLSRAGTFFSCRVSLHLEHDFATTNNIRTRELQGESVESSPEMHAAKWPSDLDLKQWKRLRPEWNETQQALHGAALRFFLEYDHYDLLFPGLIEAKKDLSRQMFKVSAKMAKLADDIFVNTLAEVPYPPKDAIDGLLANIDEISRMTIEVGSYVADMLHLLQNQAFTGLSRVKRAASRKVAEPELLVLLPMGLRRAGDAGLVDEGLKDVAAKLGEKGERALWEDREVLRS